MQQPNMIVLGLIAQGFRYGFEMERFIELSKMRLWARIGKSTIYKVLRDLKKTGDVTEKKENAERGPGKAVFSLTKDGKRKLLGLVRAALSSRESVYSDRIAGLVFSRALPKRTAVSEIEKCIAGLSLAIKAVEGQRKALDDKPVANVVLNFYRKVYKAEQEAMIEMKSVLR